MNGFDAVEFCNRLSVHEGLSPAYAVDGETVTWSQAVGGYRLPTEAEWEYAVRAGSTSQTYAGDLEIHGRNNAPMLADIAWYGGNSGSEHPKACHSSTWPDKQYAHSRAATQPVGRKQPNAWGLYDMSGNVREWIWDWSAAYIKPAAISAPLLDPVGPTEGTRRVLRGGSWGSDVRECRSAARRGWPPVFRSGGVGFRIARTYQPDWL